MDSNFQLNESIFNNDVVLARIFSSLDLPTVKMFRLVSTKFANVGFSHLKRNPDKVYLKFWEISSRNENWNNVEAQNREILEWSLKPQNSWILKQVKIPIHEAIKSQTVQDFLSTHGHKITHLKLYRQNATPINKISDCRTSFFDSPQTLIVSLLSTLTPNLQHLSIFDDLFDRHHVDIRDELSLPELLKTSLRSFELSRTQDNYFSRFPQQFSQEFVAQLILNSPNLKELKIGYDSGCSPSGAGIIEHFRKIPQFGSNIEVFEAGFDIDVMPLKYLTEQRFPRLKKLILNSQKQGRFYFSRVYPSPVHFGVREIIWSSFSYFQENLPILLSLFPNLETLTIDSVKRYYKAGEYKFFQFNATFPNVKKLILKADSENLFFPRILKQLLRLMPEVEALEISGLESSFYFKVILKGIQEAEALKELELNLGKNYKSWDRKEILDRFPKHLRICVRD